MMALADSFNVAFTMKRDPEQIIGKELPLHMYTDSLSLFGIIKKSSATSEKRLMVDLNCVKNAYNSMKISEIFFTRLKFNLADSLKEHNFNTILIKTKQTTK